LALLKAHCAKKQTSMKDYVSTLLEKTLMKPENIRAVSSNAPRSCEE
jgi:hypothetical protein